MDFHCCWQLTSCSIPGYGRNFMIHQTSLSLSINTHWLTGCRVQHCVVCLSGHQVSMQPSVLFILVPCGLWKKEVISTMSIRAWRCKVGPLSGKAAESNDGLCSFSRKLCRWRWTLGRSGSLAGLDWRVFWGRWENSSATAPGKGVILIHLGKSRCGGHGDTETQIIPG